jgi:hypothetical protein
MWLPEDFKGYRQDMQYTLNSAREKGERQD